MYLYKQKRIWGDKTIYSRLMKNKHYRHVKLDAYVKDTDTLTYADLLKLGYSGTLKRTIEACQRRTNTIITRIDEETWDIQPIKILVSTS